MSSKKKRKNNNSQNKNVNKQNTTKINGTKSNENKSLDNVDKSTKNVNTKNSNVNKKNGKKVKAKVEVNKDLKKEVKENTTKKETEKVNKQEDNSVNSKVKKETKTVKNTDIKENNDKTNKEKAKTSKKSSNNKNKENRENKKDKDKLEDNKDNSNKELSKKDSNNKESNKEKAKDKETKEIIKVNEEEKPEYIAKMLKKKKMKKIIIIGSIILALIIFFFSTIFALCNSFNNSNDRKIISGVLIDGIDVSGLNKEEAKNKVNENLNNELKPTIQLIYEDYTNEFDAQSINFAYKIDEAVNSAFEIGTSKNLIFNNYDIIFAKVFGKNIKVDYEFNQEEFDNYIEGVNSNLNGVVVEPSYYIEDNKLVVVNGTDGIKIDKEYVENEIINDLISRDYNEINDEYSQKIDIKVINEKASKIDMDKIYNEIYKEPKDAYYTKEPYAIYADEDGVDLEISLDEAKNEIEKENKTEYTFDLKITKATVTIKDLGTEAFPNLLSSFSTKYDASNTNRSTNLQLAASKINGTVLMPGETFSFNKVVGKRTVEDGYKDAKIYADGGVVDGLAGGICQISSTLYNAVLLSDLQIVERSNHSFTTSYLPAGRDATVVWGTKDFQFLNNRSYPIKIESTVNNGIAEFKIYGIQEDRGYDEIKILPYQTGTIVMPVQYVTDATLSPGQQVVSQAGHSGSRVTTYKVKYLNGVEISRELLSNDTYQAMTRIVRVGP